MSSFCAENCDVESLEDLKNSSCPAESALIFLEAEEEVSIRPSNFCQFVVKYARHRTFQRLLEQYLANSPEMGDEEFITQLLAGVNLYNILMKEVI